MFRAVSKIRSVGRVGAAKSGATCSRGFSAGMWQGASDPNKRSASASSSSPSFSSSTHQVFNQSKPFVEVDLFSSDRPLQRAVTGLTSFAHQRDKDTAMHVLQQHGVSSGKLNIMESAEHAEANIPKLDSFDQYGNRLDTIRYHPAYHELMAHGVAAGATSYGYNQSDAHGQMNGHVVRAALMNMQNQLEPGHCCPLVMTSAAIPVLQAAAHSSAAVGTDKASSAHAQLWLDKVLSRRYDSSNKPIHQKEGATLGMSMTEKQGGSDIRANTTTAVPEEENIAGEGAAYRLWGHKWFTSAPMCDGFLTLAKVSPPNSGAEELREVRPTCFLVPRWLPDGSRNSGFRIMRLKNKLADRANASSEVEYHGAYGQMLGGEGKGLQTILKMVQMTRLDCTLGAAGGARRALSLALNHAHTRSAFGTPLVQQPMMENLLTDLCITSEAMTLSAMRMASAHARSTLGSQTGLSAEEIAHESDVFRVGVAILKYYCTKAAPNFAYECMEIFGGNGFTEDHAMARLFRHSPLNSIWEGSGNIMALDVLRASKALPAFVKDMQQGVRGDNKYFDAYCDSLSSLLGKMAGLSPTEHAAGDAQRMARFLVDRLAIGYQASLLLKLGHENGAAADAFIQSRIYPAVSTGNSNPTAFGLNYGATTIFDPSLARLIIDDHSPVFASSRPDNINWDRTL